MNTHSFLASQRGIFLSLKKSIDHSSPLLCSWESAVLLLQPLFPSSHQAVPALAVHGCASVYGFGTWRSCCVQWWVSLLMNFIQALTSFGGLQKQQRVSHPKPISTFPMLSLCLSLSELRRCTGAICASRGPCHKRSPFLPFAVAWDHSFAF